MCIYIHTCVCTYIDVYMYICTCICIYIYTYMYTHMMYINVQHTYVGLQGLFGAGWEEPGMAADWRDMDINTDIDVDVDIDK